MPLVGVETVKQKFKKTFEDIDLKGRAAVQLAATIGAGHATLMVPVDTGNLVNSRFIAVTDTPKGYRGRAGFTASYAAAVHEMSGKLKGQPREHFGKTQAGAEFGGGTGNGTYWAPQGEPQFLRKGFEDNLDEIRKVVKQAMKL